MFRSIRRLFVYLCLATITILSAFFLFNHLQSSTVAAVGEIGTITGTVQSPEGAAVPINTTVALLKLDSTEPEQEMFFKETTANPANGSFTFTDMPFDYYILVVIPPIESPLAPSPPMFFPLEELNHDVGAVNIGYTQIQGAVVAPDGVTPVEAMLMAVDENSGMMMESHTMDGLYRFGGLPPGSYTLKAMPEEGPYWENEPISVTIGISNTQLLTLTLTSPDLWGYAVDSEGNPLPDTDVFIIGSGSGPGSAPGPGPGNFYGDHTDGNGIWAIGELPNGNYKLEAAPPWHKNNLMPPEPLEVSIPGTSSPITLTFAALGSGNKTVSGAVRTASGDPVDDAIIFAHHMDMYFSTSTETDANGEYQLDLTPGQWSIMIEPKRDFNGMPNGDWIYAKMPKFVTFADNETPESMVVDFAVTEADAMLIGQIKLPDGSVPPFEVAIDVFNSEGYGGHTKPYSVDGRFEMPLPAGGYELYIFPFNPDFEGPEMITVHIEPGETLDLGVINLVGQDAMITGQVMADSEPVSGFPIMAWKKETGAFKQTETFPNGQYELPVSSGTWYVMPAFDHNQTYVYSGEGREVEVEFGQTATGIDFELLGTNSTISGLIVDESGNPLGDVHGWASVESMAQQNNSQTGSALHTGAPIINGRFDIQVPAGNYRIFIHLDDSGGYFAGQETTVTVAANETASVTIAATTPDATITGHLVDKRTGNPVTGLEGFVWAWNEGKGANAMTDPTDGSYKIDVVAGKWHVDHWVDDAHYMSLWQENSTEIGQGETAVVDLEVVQKDATVSGRVLDPNGTPIPGSMVIIEGHDDLHGIWLFADTDATGAFTMEVPFGKYRLEASIGPSNWFAPESIEVEVGAGEHADGNVLQFREASATLNGTLTALGANMDGHAYLWAWSEDGGHTNSTTILNTDGTDATGNYSFGVVSGSTWHVGAVFENEMNFWFAEGTVTIDGNSATFDLDLQPGGTMPDPAAITFAASEPLDLKLDDGTEIFIPAGAMPITGTVNLRIEPVAALPNQDHADVLNYGYQILATDENGRPIEDSFNQDVTIYFSYDDSGMTSEEEANLKPAYFSTTTNQWTIPENFVIDTEANEVTLNINHFTDFAVVNNQANTTYNIFLPMITD